ncbi:PD-(D/E)XK nuclease family protein [Winogradskyella echinorum]|uniref:PD-(D/E)XK nuclease family protein n=1 Tax=Winogradskyella echinorum TaxID=538189 RepID=A0ABR6XZN0_9FLAO|nr:PD-(D/E)XK nuclease family protein [Winogradskyella echinorum]MBC3845849.1 PD-(D/E)XK nuclease family protein [Winogradskyella echinorum]MBC5750197.1 PD-(D/E)XK nuclease family protein [Winogradskyella echinorum]
MISFIKSVLVDLKSKGLKLEDLHFILPSKRAGVFLKHHLSTLLSQPIFAPNILSIEEFVEELSGLQTIPNTELLFKLYDSYKKLTNEADIESFDSFSKWAQILLQDFNEIDRYLIPQEDIFDYLNAIKELNHWSLEAEQTELVKNHLKFWKRLKNYYLDFTENLLQNKKGYQGLIYREAAENLEVYINSNTEKTHVFLGFNALNESESRIIQGLLQDDLAYIYWDIDRTFIDDPIHDAGLFTRIHRKKWNYFKKHPFNWITSNYSEEKTIEVIETPKLVGQAKYIGQLLENISKSNKNLSSVAVVLGEENLLIPVLNSIPKAVTNLNVTMGLPLKFVPLASFFEHLFVIHKNNPKNYYYKDVINILSHPSLYPLFKTESSNTASEITNYIQKNNLVYITIDDLKAQTNLHTDIIKLLFKPWEDNAENALNSCSDLIFKMKTNIDANKNINRLELEYLYRFNTLFNQLSELNSNYKYLNTVSTLQTIYKELLSSETLDFKGEPLEGLQIMGMLESRVLDFETVIISSVNEGILPSGKTNNSFIPFDVKVQNGLPTFKEKDAVYTYHFYRLLQRAKNVYILYNTEVDALKGGEKSRFITQLEIEGIHNIKHTTASPDVPIIKKQLKQITKTPLVTEKIKELALKGFSPSSLTNYIRNPIDFYFEKILGIKDFEDVEENIAANTMGSVIHNTLEDFYKPLEGEFLTVNHLETFKKQIKQTVSKHFKDLYKDGDFSKGKNLIIFEIAQRYISNFLNSEIESLNTGNQIKILAIEAEKSVEIKIEGLDFPIKLNGKVDRIDELNGITRVIDYKSGKVEQNKVEIVDWEDLTTDYDKYSKSFQVLCYAYMMRKNNLIQLPIEAGIISFKNLNKGFLKFGKKQSSGSRTKDQLITQETLNNFEIELKKLILEICNSKVDFIEKELE